MAIPNIAQKRTAKRQDGIDIARKFTAADCNKIVAAITGNDSDIRVLKNKTSSIENTISGWGADIASLKSWTAGKDGFFDSWAAQKRAIDKLGADLNGITEQIADLDQLGADVRDLKTKADGIGTAVDDLITTTTTMNGLIAANTDALAALDGIPDRLGAAEATISRVAGEVEGDSGEMHDIAANTAALEDLRVRHDSEIGALQQNLAAAQAELGSVGRATHYQELVNTELQSDGVTPANLSININRAGIYLFHGDEDLTIRIPDALQGTIELRTEARSTLFFDGKFVPGASRKMRPNSQPLFLRWVPRNYLNTPGDAEGSHGIYLY